MKFKNILLLAICFFNYLQVSAEPFRVGILAPLSGWAAHYGDALQKGLQLFQEEQGKLSKNITFIYEDSRYDGTQVITGAKKLAQVDNVELIFVWGDTPSHIAAPLAEQLKKPLLTLSFDSVATGRSNVASLTIPLSDFKTVLADFLLKRQWTKIGVIASNIGATTAFLDELRPALPLFSFERWVNTDLQDFNAIVTSVKNIPVDAVFLSLSTDQYDAFKKAASTQKYKTFIIGGDQLSDQGLRESLNDISTGIAYLVGQINNDFSERYNKRFQDRSHVYEAATGYSVGMILSVLANQLTTDPKKLIATLPTLKFEQTPIGSIVFSSSKKYGVNAKLTPGIQVEK